MFEIDCSETFFWYSLLIHLYLFIFMFVGLNLYYSKYCIFLRKKLPRSLLYQCNFNVSGFGQNAKTIHTGQIDHWHLRRKCNLSRITPSSILWVLIFCSSHWYFVYSSFDPILICLKNQDIPCGCIWCLMIGEKLLEYLYIRTMEIFEVVQYSWNKVYQYNEGF